MVIDRRGFFVLRTGMKRVIPVEVTVDRPTVVNIPGVGSRHVVGATFEFGPTTDHIYCNPIDLVTDIESVIVAHFDIDDDE